MIFAKPDSTPWQSDKIGNFHRPKFHLDDLDDEKCKTISAPVAAGPLT